MITFSPFESFKELLKLKVEGFSTKYNTNFAVLKRMLDKSLSITKAILSAFLNALKWCVMACGTLTDKIYRICFHQGFSLYPNTHETKKGNAYTAVKVNIFLPMWAYRNALMVMVNVKRRKNILKFLGKAFFFLSFLLLIKIYASHSAKLSKVLCDAYCGTQSSCYNATPFFPLF